MVAKPWREILIPLSANYKAPWVEGLGGGASQLGPCWHSGRYANWLPFLPLPFVSRPFKVSLFRSLATHPPRFLYLPILLYKAESLKPRLAEILPEKGKKRRDSSPVWWRWIQDCAREMWNYGAITAFVRTRKQRTQKKKSKIWRSSDLVAFKLQKL